MIISLVFERLKFEWCFAFTIWLYERSCEICNIEIYINMLLYVFDIDVEKAMIDQVWLLLNIFESEKSQRSQSTNFLNFRNVDVDVTNRDVSDDVIRRDVISLFEIVLTNEIATSKLLVLVDDSESTIWTKFDKSHRRSIKTSIVLFQFSIVCRQIFNELTSRLLIAN